jgi:glycosyltransferase involved in cell wall biosynthesis
MKKIGIDARLYSQTGVGTYINNLLHYLQKEPVKDITFYVFIMEKEMEKVKLTDSRFVKVPVRSIWHSFAEQIQFLNILNKYKLDLMHFTYFSFPILYRKPFVATIHDLTPIYFKTGSSSTRSPATYLMKFYVLKYMLHIQINSSKFIFTPSSHVKSQILKYSSKDISNKIIVTQEGVSHDLKYFNRQSKGVILPDNYMLYVGNFYPHKNVDFLIDAFIDLNQDRHYLVLVGPSNVFSDKLKNKFKNFSEKKIIFLHKITNNQISEVYSRASVLVNPSISEGFGLPLVEALYFNCPVLASNIAPFVEILGDKANYFNPYEKASLIKQLQNVKNLKTVNLKDEFDFEKMTKKTLFIYKKAIS